MDPVFGLAILSAMGLVIGRMLSGGRQKHTPIQPRTVFWDYINGRRVFCPNGVCVPDRSNQLTGQQFVGRDGETVLFTGEVDARGYPISAEVMQHNQYVAERKVYFERVAAGLDGETGLPPVHVFTEDQNLKDLSYLDAPSSGVINYELNPHLAPVAQHRGSDLVPGDPWSRTYDQLAADEAFYADRPLSNTLPPIPAYEPSWSEPVETRQHVHVRRG